MKKKLIIIFALCFTFSTVANATANVEMNIETEESTAVEQIVEPEFSLLVETVTEIGAEAETEAEKIEAQTDEITTKIESETIEEIVTEVESSIIDDAAAEVQSTDIEIVTENETDAASEPSSMPIGEVTEVATMEGATDIIEEDSEYVAAVVNAIVIGDEVTTEGEEIFVQIEGENLLDKCANIKVRPTNTYKNFYYIRTIVLENDFDNMIRIALPEGSAGLYRVDVDVEKVARETKVIAIGESGDSELKCEANRKTAVITGQSKTEGEKAIMVKIVDDSGKIVYLRQLTTEADGSYVINATLPEESAIYIVWVTVEGESSGYVKTMIPFGPNNMISENTYTLISNENEINSVIVYGKNITDKGKYIYEVDYSESAAMIEIADLCAFTRDNEISKGYTENRKMEVLSVSGGKIRFVVENDAEYNNSKAWSGIVNVLKLKKLTSQGVNITLRVYE